MLRCADVSFETNGERMNKGLFTSDRGDWETPRSVFEKCDAIWHFDLDAASSDGNALCERHYTLEDNGLEMPWGGSVWVNPPYGREIGAWVEKAVRETRGTDTVVVMLLPARTDTRWWQDNVMPYAAEVSFLRGRCRFTVGGKEAGTAPFPSALVRFGGELPKDAR
jgi:phage N-6-adenine-methyltransferase